MDCLFYGIISIVIIMPSLIFMTYQLFRLKNYLDSKG